MLLFLPLWKRKMHRRAIQLSTKCDHACYRAVYACMSMCMHACVYMHVCVWGGGSKGTCLSETWHQIKGGTQISPKQLKPKLVLVNSCKTQFKLANVIQKTWSREVRIFTYTSCGRCCLPTEEKHAICSIGIRLQSRPALGTARPKPISFWNIQTWKKKVYYLSIGIH